MPSKDLAVSDDDTGKLEVEEPPRHVEIVRTISRVPGNSNYYEKNGLRTEGDGIDHTVYNPVR